MQKFLMGFVLSYLVMVTFYTGGGGLPELFAHYFHYYYFSPASNTLQRDNESTSKIDAGA